MTYTEGLCKMHKKMFILAFVFGTHLNIYNYINNSFFPYIKPKCAMFWSQCGTFMVTVWHIVLAD